MNKKKPEMRFKKDFNPILPNIITLAQGNYREESQTDNLMVVYKPNLVRSAPAKGQLISKCPYEKSVLSKIPTKNFPRFLP